MALEKVEAAELTNTYIAFLLLFKSGSSPGCDDSLSPS